MCSKILNIRGQPPFTFLIICARHSANVIHVISWLNAVGPTSMKLNDVTIVFLRFCGFFLSPVVNSSNPMMMFQGGIWAARSGHGRLGEELLELARRADHLLQQERWLRNLPRKVALSIFQLKFEMP